MQHNITINSKDYVLSTHTLTQPNKQTIPSYITLRIKENKQETHNTN
jgi:hypothetical protein